MARLTGTLEKNKKNVALVCNNNTCKNIYIFLNISSLTGVPVTMMLGRVLSVIVQNGC
jgi:hypothetical protein